MTKQRKGLKFKYNIGDKILSQHFVELNDFLYTKFPKNNSLMSPTNETTLFDVKLDNKPISLCSGCHKLSEVKEILYNYNPNKLERKNIYSIEEVREKVKDALFEKDRRLAKVDFDGDLIKGNSQRYQTFFTKGCKCVNCGIEGKYFAKEKHLKDKSFHLNLYAIDKNGDEVLMTKDHIIPKSKGGIDDLSNYQTMCERCNKEKGNELEK